MLLELHSVSYIYRTKYQITYAVNGVTGAFECGKVYTIMGPSGSGKTTLLSLCAGLDIPCEGEICFAGKPTTQLDRDAFRREHVSVIYQSFNLFSHLTALENVAYPLYLRGVPIKQANEEAQKALLTVGLTKEQCQRRPAMLSGGEQQRVAIARALCSGSELILGDEPTGNLDTENRESIVKIFRNLAREKGRCVILVTHDPEVAKVADTVLNMRDGRIESVTQQDFSV